MSRKTDSANYGIIGNVQASAVAVGARATASVTDYGSAAHRELERAIEALHGQIDSLQIPEEHRAAMKADLTKIERAAGPAAKAAGSGKTGVGAGPDVLSRLVQNLKNVGVLVQSATALTEPLKVIAAWFHVPLPF